VLIKPGSTIDEDSLTNAVFGFLRYVPPDLWFGNLIRELLQKNPRASGPLACVDSAVEVSLWPTYRIPPEWRPHFWRPRSKKGQPAVPKGTICPDAQIKAKRWIMLIESEYSHDLEAEQMFQQFAIACQRREEDQLEECFVLLVNGALTRPSHCGVEWVKGKKPSAAVTSEDSLETYITESCKCCQGCE
jgi:hypothetical protein